MPINWRLMDGRNDDSRVYGEGGILLPFALNCAPNGVSAPPPAGLVWQSPHDLPVALAKAAVADAGMANTSAPAAAMIVAAASPVTMANALVSFMTDILELCPRVRHS